MREAPWRERRNADGPLQTFLQRIQAALWREDPSEVAALYEAMLLRDVWDEPNAFDGKFGLRAERLRELRRPLPQRPRKGLTITEMARHASVDRETMARALEHHGYVTLAPFGGRQQRRLVSDQATAAGYGHNADGSNTHIAALEGLNRASVFAVFYEDHVPSVLWTLDLDGIRDRATAIVSKRHRLKWLLASHGYLPSGFIASLAGCTERAVKKARARMGGESSLASYRYTKGSLMASATGQQ